MKHNPTENVTARIAGRPFALHNGSERTANWYKPPNDYGDGGLYLLRGTPKGAALRLGFAAALDIWRSHLTGEASPYNGGARLGERVEAAIGGTVYRPRLRWGRRMLLDNRGELCRRALYGRAGDGTPTLDIFSGQSTAGIARDIAELVDHAYRRWLADVAVAADPSLSPQPAAERLEDWQRGLTAADIAAARRMAEGVAP